MARDSVDKDKNDAKLGTVESKHRLRGENFNKKNEPGMTKKTLIIALIAICFSYGIMAGPVMAAECIKMMGCMPAHSEDHLPDAGDDYTCSCNQTPLQLTNSACASTKRNLMVAPAESYPDLGHGLAPDHAYAWITLNKFHSSRRIHMDNAPTPHLPAFILNQAFLC